MQVGSDLLLAKYSAIVIDEAHERGINSDLLLGILSRVVVLRRERHERAVAAGGGVAAAGTPGPLKLIIMSATLQVEAFRANPRLFPSPPTVLQVEARQYPVTTHFARTTPEDHLLAAYKKVCKIHSRLPAGGILVFMTGKAEIDELVARLRRRLGRRHGRRSLPAAGGSGTAGAGAGGAAPAEADEETQAELAEARRAAEATAEAAAEEVARVEAQTSSTTAVPADGCGLLIGDETEEGGRPSATGLDGEGGEGGQVEEAGESGSEDEESFSEGGSEDEGESEEEGEGEEEDDEEALSSPVLVLPLYSMLPAAEQMRVWAPPPPGARLIVVATNVAETSITIPGISYVVDCGKHKQRTYAEIRRDTPRYAEIRRDTPTTPRTPRYAETIVDVVSRRGGLMTAGAFPQ